MYPCQVSSEEDQVVFWDYGSGLRRGQRMGPQIRESSTSNVHLNHRNESLKEEVQLERELWIITTKTWKHMYIIKTWDVIIVLLYAEIQAKLVSHLHNSFCSDGVDIIHALP